MMIQLIMVLMLLVFLCFVCKVSCLYSIRDSLDHLSDILASCQVSGFGEDAAMKTKVGHYEKKHPDFFTETHGEISLKDILFVNSFWVYSVYS